MNSLRVVAAVVSFYLFVTSAPNALAEDQTIRIGIVGCDTSHVIAFTKLINDPAAAGDLAKCQVTAAFPGGSPDLPTSRDRVDDYVKQLRGMGVKIVDSLEALTAETDAVLLESVDGRPHLAQFRAIAKGKPVFIDKPTAASLADVIAIFRVADQTKTPVFSSSSLRFCAEVQSAARDQSIGALIGCETTSPLSPLEHHPDLFFYGIHGVEPLYTIMGTGCQSVSRADSPLATLVVGKWKDGRIGSYRGLKKGHSYAFTTFGERGVAQKSGFSGYGPCVDAICKFFVTHEPPVTREETVEIYAFMEAADESKRQAGKPVAISDVIRAADHTAASAK